MYTFFLVESIQRITHHNNIIGHSQGGLVACYYAEFLALKKKVEAVICLGTPFLGTKLSVFGTGPAVKEVAPHSVFLCKLKELFNTLQFLIIKREQNR